MDDGVPFWHSVGFGSADNDGKYATLIVGGVIPLLESILVAWTGWIFAENGTDAGALLVGLGALGAALGTFIAVLTIVELGSWISGTI